MSLLDTFKPFDFTEGIPSVSITINGITFNKSVTKKLGFPQFVVLLIDKETRRIAIKKCSEESPNATHFYRERKNKSQSVRWNGRDLINTISLMTGWDLSKSGYRIEGTFLPEEGAVLFDLSLAKELN